MNWWDDGSIDSGFAVGDKDYDLGSRFAITGSATIAPGWSRRLQSDRKRGRHNFGIYQQLRTMSSPAVNSAYTAALRAHQHALLLYLHQERHARHPELGSFEPGVGQPGGSRRHLRHRDRIRTSCSSRARGFFMRPKGSLAASVVSLAWHGRLLALQLGRRPPRRRLLRRRRAGGPLRLADLGWLPVRDLLWYRRRGAGILDADAGNTNTMFFDHPTTDDSHFWDIAAFYTADWNSIKISLAGAYTWMESQSAQRRRGRSTGRSAVASCTSRRVSASTPPAIGKRGASSGLANSN